MKQLLNIILLITSGAITTYLWIIKSDNWKISLPICVMFMLLYQWICKYKTNE